MRKNPEALLKRFRGRSNILLRWRAEIPGILRVEYLGVDPGCQSFSPTLKWILSAEKAQRSSFIVSSTAWSRSFYAPLRHTLRRRHSDQWRPCPRRYAG